MAGDDSFYPELEWLMKPGSFGTYCSFAVLVIGFIISLITRDRASAYPVQLKDKWAVGCPHGFDHQCAQNSAVYRASFALTIIFVLQMFGTYFVTKFYDYWWYWKIVVFASLIAGFQFVDGDVSTCTATLGSHVAPRFSS